MPEPFLAVALSSRSGNRLHHDQDKDEIRMTLSYKGIFETSKEVRTYKSPDDKATPEKLNQLQIEQLASVLNEKQTFLQQLDLPVQTVGPQGNAQEQARRQ